MEKPGVVRALEECDTAGRATSLAKCRFFAFLPGFGSGMDERGGADGAVMVEWPAVLLCQGRPDEAIQVPEGEPQPIAPLGATLIFELLAFHAQCSQGYSAQSVGDQDCDHQESDDSTF